MWSHTLKCSVCGWVLGHYESDQGPITMPHGRVICGYCIHDLETINMMEDHHGSKPNNR